MINFFVQQGVLFIFDNLVLLRIIYLSAMLNKVTARGKTNPGPVIIMRTKKEAPVTRRKNSVAVFSFRFRRMFSLFFFWRRKE